MNQEMTPLAEGIAAADAEGYQDAEAKRVEALQVSQWQQRIKDAQEFDKEVRKGYARDRRYARGDSGFEVDTNLIGSNLDTMVSFIYARDPDVDVIPSQQVEAPKQPPPTPPPPAPGIEALISNPTELLGSGDIEQGLAQAGFQMAAQQEQAQQAQMAFEAEWQQWNAEQQAKRARKLELDLFSQTLEIVIGKLWKRGKMKRQARKAVRSAMTVSIGWLKLSWQERTERDPLVQQQINDLQNALSGISALQREVADSTQPQDIEVKRLEIQQRMTALNETVERVVARGMAIDFVKAENLQVAPGTDLMNVCESPWVNETVYMRIEDAAKTFPNVSIEKLRTATRYHQTKPMIDHGAPEAVVTAEEASEYKRADTFNVTPSDADYIAVYETWSLDDGVVYTSADGVKCFLKPPAAPNVASDRFYPYFPLAFIEVDGERAPQSLVQRSWKLQNEYSRTRTAWAEHRRRSRLGVLFDAGEVDPENAKKLEKGLIQELTGIRLTTQGRDIRQVFTEKPVARIDPAIYDTGPILADMDRIWGISDALRGSVEVAKTATEAEIQQSGFQGRTSSMRDTLEDWLTEIARYTALIATQKLTPEDVLTMAGPDAIWPQMEGPDDLEQLVDVDIRAGSSGKPNTRGEREAWSTVLPLIQSAQAQVGQLRGAGPSEIADKVEALIEETLNRTGDRLDVSRLLPQSEGQMPQPQQQAMPMPGPQPQAMQSPQGQVPPPMGQ